MDHLPDLSNLRPENIIAQAARRLVVHRMVPQFIPCMHQIPQDGPLALVLGDLGADHEERGRCVVGLQDTEDVPRVRRRSVIDRERHESFVGRDMEENVWPAVLEVADKPKGLLVDDVERDEDDK